MIWPINGMAKCSFNPVAVSINLPFTISTEDKPDAGDLLYFDGEEWVTMSASSATTKQYLTLTADGMEWAD